MSVPMIGNRNSQHSFSVMPSVNHPRSTFDRSFGFKDTFDFDYLTPFYVDEVLPGDTFNCSVNTFARLSSPLKVPLMDNMYVDYFFFFVPNRLVYDNWEKMMGFQENPGDSTDYILPQLQLGAMEQWEVGTIYDKIDLVTDVNNILLKNTLPLRGYNLIWNEWFRDQNMQDSVAVPKDAGPDALSDFTLLKRGKRHDYFTAALPFPQKGPVVDLPLGSRAPVYGIGMDNSNFPHSNGTVRETNGTGEVTYATYRNSSTADGNNQVFFEQDPDNPGFPNIWADLSAATAATINQFREAIQIQGLYELDARGGTRYVELLRAHFGVISPDFRLQRPEFLGGGQNVITSQAVPQTAPTSGSNPQGQLAAYSVQHSSGKNIGFSKSFVEHGYVIGLMCARADITYQQGMPRTYNRSTRLDFAWPKLQQIGEQAILNKEIFAQGQSVTNAEGIIDDQPFGYIERFGEYKYNPSRIRGQFRSTYTTPLDQWHLAAEFSALPELNEDFIVQNTPMDRVLAVTSAPDLLMDGFVSLNCARPLMTHSVPATLGRF